jgi:hypothetical protein
MCARVFGNGVQDFSVAIGLVMSELVVDGRAKTVDIQAFRTNRFSLEQLIKAEYKYIDD